MHLDYGFIDIVINKRILFDSKNKTHSHLKIKPHISLQWRPDLHTKILMNMSPDRNFQIKTPTKNHQ